MEINVRDEAVKLFNQTWDLMDIPKAERTVEQNAEMLRKAHASRYLWGLVGEPINLARGDWQVSRAYAVQGYGAPALLHGKLSLNIALKENATGLDLAFGYEAVARAYAIIGDVEKAKENKAQGLEAAAAIEDKAGREYTEGELNGVV